LFLKGAIHTKGKNVWVDRCRNSCELRIHRSEAEGDLRIEYYGGFYAENLWKVLTTSLEIF